MTTICITGDSPLALTAIANRFRQAGMAADMPLQRDSSISLAVWHQRVLASAQQPIPVGERAIQPSRLWEQLAVDLLVANIDAPLWGWTDPASVALLDFWAGLDDSIRFVLVCRSREQAVAEWLCASADERSETEVLADWQRQQQALIRFRLHYPARSMLVWADEAQAVPQSLMAQIKQQWGLCLELPEGGQQAGVARDAVLRQLTAGILHQHPESSELDGELHATVLSLTTDYPAPHATPETSELICGYRRLLDRSAEQAALAAARSACEAEANAKSQALEQRDAEAKAKAEAQSKLKEAQQEGELLLQQLHTVQEELEKQFLQHKEDQAQRQKQVAELTKELDAEAKAKTEALTQRDAEAAAKRDAQAQLKEAQQEGELLLQQLHTVQEELEQYYLKQQATQRDLDQLKTRWARLLKSQPGLVDVDVVELASDGSDSKSLRWRLKQACLAGRQFDQLEFETVVEQGVAGFVWHRPAKGAGALARWPASAKGDQTVTILPISSGPDAMRRAAHLVQLSTSDSDLMLALPALLKRAMQAGQIELAPQRQQQLAEALDRYQQIMGRTQALVRFDGASLVGQQATRQRDVIAVALAGLSLGALRLPGFEFQVQLNKAADGSTESMHLIFGEQTSGSPFKGWFSNVPNTAGNPVMALHLTPQGWAAADWAALPEEDRAFIQALADSLAVMLVTLQADGVRAERAWPDWLKQAASLRQWSRQTPAPVLASPSPAEAEILPTPQPPALVELETAAPELLPEPLSEPAVTSRPAPRARKPRAKPAAKKTPAKPVVAPDTAAAPRTSKRRAS